MSIQVSLPCPRRLIWSIHFVDVVLDPFFIEQQQFKRKLNLYHTIPHLTTLKKMSLENIVGKGENAGNQHFPFSHSGFYFMKERNCHFITVNICRLKMLSIWS